MISARLFFLIVLSSLLWNCASSNVSREAAANIDDGVLNAKRLTSGSANIAEAYQNSSQTTKGAIIGGTAGAITGALTSGVGVLPGTATGLIIGASYGNYIDSNTSLEDRLINHGATVIELGDQLMVVLPSSRIFQPFSAEIKPQSYSTLFLVSRYINKYTKMLVKVAAYTNASGSPRVDLVLSQQQAGSVVKFLTASGIDARLLYAVGYGGTNLVERNCGDWDGSDNYRIEITLEKLYV